MNELEFLATLVHVGLASIHGKVAAFGSSSSIEAGAATALHSISIAYNLRRHNWADVLAHLAGIGAIHSTSRRANAAACFYDASSAVDHAREIFA